MLPPNALDRINLGQSFAEYDRVLTRPGVFVTTPATQAALDPDRGKVFFVGRRGTGKTAIALFWANKTQNTFMVHPNVLTPKVLPGNETDFVDPKKRPLKSIIAAFELNLAAEAVSQSRAKKASDKMRSTPSAKIEI